MNAHVFMFCPTDIVCNHCHLYNMSNCCECNWENEDSQMLLEVALGRVGI